MSSSPPTPSLYPLASTPLAHLAYSSAFDEISNSAGSLAHRARLSPKGPPPPRTTKTILFVLYQAGQHGPQNGFRIIFVEERNDPEEMERLAQERGGIGKETRELLFFPTPTNPSAGGGGGMIVWPDDEHEGISSSSRTREILARIANSTAVDVVPSSSIALFVRKVAVYPLFTKKTIPVVSSATLTGRGKMFVAVDGEGEGGGRTLVLFKEENSPEEIERVVLESIGLVAEEGGGSRMIVFGRARAGEGVDLF